MKFFEDLIRKENLLARIACLLVACGLWVYVMTDQNPIVERNVEVRLQQLNLPNNMMVFNVPDKVMVKIRGTRTKVSDNLENKITASLNLKNVTEGQQSLPVKVSFAAGDVVQVTPNEVSVYVDTVSEKKVPVITRIVGAVSSDMTIGHSIITPAQVTLRGATHRMNKVNKVVAPIDVTDHQGDFQTESELVAVSDDGYDIPNMKIIPERVMVQATMVSQMLSVDIPVQLVVSGELPKDVTVTKTEILPEKVRITAPPSLLKDLKAINTKPVDVSKLTGSTVVAAELDLPEKVIPELRTVRIRLSVERQSNK
ncbi:MAG: CdaR family protein [Phascolarctobacterium sp.]|nr:CdaR family protein [Phascolarctobacterium sp.]